MIAKDTLVQVRTTNGGETYAMLLEDYKPAYGVTISRPHGGHCFIPSWRIVSIEAVTLVNP